MDVDCKNQVWHAHWRTRADGPKRISKPQVKGSNPLSGSRNRYKNVPLTTHGAWDTTILLAEGANHSPLSHLESGSNLEEATSPCNDEANNSTFSDVLDEKDVVPLPDLYEYLKEYPTGPIPGLYTSVSV